MTQTAGVETLVIGVGQAGLVMGQPTFARGRR